jgi:hypothetical protein
MKKEKLNLTELKINSLITNLSGTDGKTLDGGIDNEGEGTTFLPSRNPITCGLSQLLHICMPFEVTELAPTLASVLGSVIRSGQRTDCAGATRAIVNCNETISPCRV